MNILKESNTKKKNILARYFDYAFRQEAEHGLYLLSIFAVIVCVIFFALLFIFVKHFNLWHLLDCRMLTLTGHPCPGCGGTRATIYFFTGHILKAIYYHAFAVYCYIMYIIFFITHTLQAITKGKLKGLKIHNWMWITALALLIIQYILKLAIPAYVL